MNIVEKVKHASNVWVDRPSFNNHHKPPMHLIRWVSIALIGCLILSVTMPAATRAEEDLQTVIEMMKKNAAHMKSFFSHSQEWSDPVFLSLTEYSIGTQIGIKESALIMLIMTDKAVDGLVKGLQKVGGTGGFALGEWGVGASAGGGIHGGWEVLMVTTSKGAFLGGGFADMKMSEIKGLNQAAYGANHE